MHSIRINKVINQMIDIFYRIGFWHRGEEATVKELRIKAFYCIYQFLFTISLAIGSITTEKSDESVFLAGTSVVSFVLSVKLWVVIWKQERILELLNRICAFSIRYDDDLPFVNREIERFINFVIFAAIVTHFTGFCELILVPCVGSERALFLNIAFPLDWRNNNIAYCVVTVFLFTEVFLTITATSFNVIAWYLMLNCSLRYQVLGSELKKMGQINFNNTTHIKENLFFEDLQAAIDNHQHIRE